ncbi:MAG: hypothetical protein ACP5SG_09470 [Dissulfurimicrobium sp.]|uniref:hypothetical protein n=1 Tax=Dissulfurimicrobium TaxID=1769732 RepID=UPI001EDA4629|nr:hypothetical protein [Dissulfurimicrobium hydrothermale]UKL13188.1 hypothetical protein LGS26_06745 [Dissulfurimicrobium hydrothermale]
MGKDGKIKLNTYDKEECLRQAVEITKNYAQSGENKHGPVAEFLENVYKKLLELKADVLKDEIQ